MAYVGEDGPARKQVKRNETTKEKNRGPSVALSESCRSRGSPSKLVQRSLLFVEMLRLIIKTTDVIDIHHFNLMEMAL